MQPVPGRVLHESLRAASMATGSHNLNKQVVRPVALAFAAAPALDPAFVLLHFFAFARILRLLFRQTFLPLVPICRAQNEFLFMWHAFPPACLTTPNIHGTIRPTG
jgi:hypothetical protein